MISALGRRKLGKALRKSSVGVSAVAVYSGDGAYDERRAAWVIYEASAGVEES